MDNIIFVKSVIVDKVKIKPQFLNDNIQRLLLTLLQAKFEGKCSHHGYIQPGSITILKYSMGSVMAVSLNGDIIYSVQFSAKVCNPSNDTVIQAKVVNTNKFGILAEFSMESPHGKGPVTILEIIVAKNALDDAQAKDLDTIEPGDMIRVKVLGKKFELNDKKISVIGKIIEDEVEKTPSEDGDGADGADSNDDDADEEVDIDDGTAEEDEEGEEKEEKDEEEDEDEDEGEEDEEEDEDDEGDEEGLFSEDVAEIFSDNDSVVSD